MRRQLSEKGASSNAFLDKFLGKTTKIGRTGISGVIAEARTETTKDLTKGVKRPSSISSIIKYINPLREGKIDSSRREK